MALNPAQVRYPVIPGISKAVQEELTTLRRMVYQLQDGSASTPTPTPVIPVPVPVTPGGGSGGGSGGGGITPGGTIYANVPLLTAIPSNNPTTGQPYANDGTVVDVAGALYRYNLSTLSWDLIVNSKTLVDTHANRLADYPSVNYALNTVFYESDRTASYWTQDAVGTVTVTGGVNVAWVTGDHFVNTGTGFTAAQWPTGTQIVINGVTCLVNSVSDDHTLTLQTATTNAVGASYSVAAGRWVYLSGRMQNEWDVLPDDLGENDATTVSTTILVNGFLFFDSVDSYHEWQWTGAAWTWGPDNDCQPGTIALRDDVPDPLTGWHLADGALNQTKYAADGTRVTNFTVPDMREAYAKFSATYTGTIAAAVAPTILGQPLTTDAAGTGDGVSESTTTVQSGAGATVVDGVSFVAAPGGHVHGIPTLTNDTDGVPATFAVLPYYRL